MPPLLLGHVFFNDAPLPQTRGCFTIKRIWLSAAGASKNAPKSYQYIEITIKKFLPDRKTSVLYRLIINVSARGLIDCRVTVIRQGLQAFGAKRADGKAMVVTSSRAIAGQESDMPAP